MKDAPTHIGQAGQHPAGTGRNDRAVAVRWPGRLFRALGPSLLILLAAPDSLSYEIRHTPTGAAYHWEVDEVPYVISSRGLDGVAVGGSKGVVTAVRRAFLSWEAVAASFLRFSCQGRDDGLLPEAMDGKNRLTWLTEAWPPEHGAPDRVVANTVVTYDRQSGVISDVDIVFNGVGFQWSLDGAAAAYDIQSIVTHEIGHLLGLGHTCGDAGTTYPSCFSLPQEQALRDRITGAVMFPSAPPGDLSHRKLTDDDAAGMAALYPAAVDMPAPGLASVTPARVTAGPVKLVIRGRALAAGAEVFLVREGVPPVKAAQAILTGAGLEADFDLRGADYADYDLMVVNPSGKKGILFAALTVALERDGGTGPGGGGGCQMTAAGPGTGGLMLLIVAFVLFRRRRW